MILQVFHLLVFPSSHLLQEPDSNAIKYISPKQHCLIPSNNAVFIVMLIHYGLQVKKD